jgi:hypothetical protein
VISSSRSDCRSGPRYAGALVLRATRAFESAMPIRLPEVAGLGQASR